MATHEEPKDIFKCNDCDKQYVKQGSLKRHVEDKHKDNAITEPNDDDPNSGNNILNPNAALFMPEVPNQPQMSRRHRKTNLYRMALNKF